MPDEPQPALISMLLRHLLGLRTRWAHSMTDAGLPAGAPPRVIVARPAPSGGARYPIEVYLATNTAPALYHYDAAHHCLDLIRTGDHRAALVSLLATYGHGMHELAASCVETGSEASCGGGCGFVADGLDEV